MQTLDQYARTGLIPAPVLASTATDLKDGGSVLNALHRHLGSRTDEVWAQLAQRSNRTFVPHPAAAGPIDARLLPLHLALDHLVLPRVRAFTTIHLLSPDPLARVTDFASLRAHFNPLVPGGQATLRIDLAPPATFRELFTLVYPDARAHWRDVEDAAALAALLPRSAWENYRPNPEEEADARAAMLGLPYIDPTTYLPTPGVLRDHPVAPFTARRLYPHSTENGHLLVLGTLMHNDELPALQHKVQTLEDALLQPMKLCLTSPRQLARLLRTLSEVHPA